MLNDNATLVIDTGNYFTANVGTPLPADLKNISLSTWTNVGHTSLDDIFGSSSDGGDATTLGTLQNKALRTRYAARTEGFQFTIQQFDKPSLKLYYGANAIELPDGTIGPNVNPVATRAAFLAVFYDGDNAFAFYAPKAEIYRGDDPSFADTESLAGLPLNVKPLQHGTNQHAFSVTPIGTIVTPTVTAATPASATVGSVVTITGTGFVGATAVKFGAVNAANFNVVSNTSITAEMPAGAAGSAPVTVTNPAGTSASFAYTRGA